MTQEEKITAIENWCKHYESESEISYCLGCPIDEICTRIAGEFNEWHPVEVESAYSIIHSNEIKDEAHERFMNIGAIKDSGNRREFETGAVRDMAEGKGRCDLMPLDIVARLLDSDVLVAVDRFKETYNADYLDLALEYFAIESNWEKTTMLLEVAKHFEEGAKKYGENNWQKGLPINCYIDSAVRHYLKWLRGDKDEPHDRAFVWNILCCAWTAKHKTEPKPKANGLRCAECGAIIYAWEDTYKTADGRYVCKECYDKQMSEVINESR